MGPLAHGVADGAAGLEHDRRHAAHEQMGRGGQPDRAGADDGNGKLGGVHDTFLSMDKSVGALGVQLGLSSPAQAVAAPWQQFSVK